MKKLVLTTAVLAALAAISVSAADAKLESFTEEVKLAGGKSFKIDMVAIPGGKVKISAPEGEKAVESLIWNRLRWRSNPSYMSKTGSNLGAV